MSSLDIYIHFIDYIPTDINCKVTDDSINSPQNEQNKNKTVILNVSWYIDHDILNDVRRFDISCDCTVSGHQIDVKVHWYCIMYSYIINYFS